MVFDIVPAYLF